MAVSTAELKVLLSATDQLTAPLGKATGALTAFGNAATHAGSSVGGMATGPMNVATGAITKVGGAATATAAALATMATRATIGGVVALGAGFTVAVKAAGDFEHQMSAVGAVMGATEAELKQLSDLALQLGKDTSFSASESAKGIEELAKAGVSLQDILHGAAQASLDLAAAGGVDVAEAATIASNAMNAFGIAGENMTHVADLIAGAANASAIDVREFGFSLQMAGAVANTVGISFDDLAVAIAELGNAGIKGSDAGTSLKTMFMNLSPQTDKAKDKMKELGIITADGANQFFDASGKAKGLAEISQVLQNATSNLTQEQKLSALSIMFGSDAIRAAAILSKEGAAGFNELAASMGKVTAAQVAEKRLDNLWGSIEKLKGSLETVSIIIGKAFTPGLKGIVDATTQLVNDSIPAVEAGANRMGEAFTNALPKIQAAFTWIEQNGIRIVKALFTAISVGLGGPLGAFIAVWPFLVAAGQKFAGWVTGPLADALGELNDALTGALRDAFDWFATEAWPSISEAGAEAVRWINTEAIGALRELGAWLGTKLAGSADENASIWKQIVNAAKGLVSFIQSQIIPRIKLLASWLGPRLEAVQRTAVALWPALVRAATTFVSMIDTKLAPGIGKIIDAIGPRLGTAIGWLVTQGWPMMISAAGQVINFIVGSALPALINLADWLGPKLAGGIQFVVTEAFPRLLTIASTVLGWISTTGIQALQALYEWLYPKLVIAFTWLTNTAWPGVQVAGQQFVSWIMSTAIPALMALFDWLSPRLAVAFTWLANEAWPAVQKAAGVAVSFIASEVIPRLQDLAEWLEPKIAGAFNWLANDAWPAVQKGAETVIDFIRSQVIPRLQELAEWLHPKIQAAFDWLGGEAWPAIQQAGGRFIEWLTGTAFPKLQELYDWLYPKLEGAFTWLTGTAWPALQGAASQFIDWINGTAIPALTELANWLKPNVEAAFNWLANEAWPGVQGAAAAAAKVWNDDVVPAAQKLYEKLQNDVSPAVLWLWTEGFPGLTQATKDLTVAIEPGLVTAWENLKLAFPQTQLMRDLNQLFDDMGYLIGKTREAIEILNQPGNAPAFLQWLFGIAEQGGTAATTVDAIRTALDVMFAPLDALLKPLELFVSLIRKIVEFGTAPGDVIDKIRGALSGASGGLLGGGPLGFGPNGGTGGGGGGTAGLGGTIAGVDLDAVARQVGGGITGALLRSLIEQESGGNPNAVSGAGAIGLTQLMPGTARGLGVDPTDPLQNVIGGATYLAQMLQMFGGDLNRALIAYNAGPGGGTPKESIDYAKRVIGGAGAAAIPNTTLPQVNQFRLGLPPDDAMSACGPAALAWFMNMTGRTPTGTEARDLAASFGWTQAGGMNGFYNFARAAASVGVTGMPNYTPTNADIQALLDSGVPFVLSTLGHYFQVQGGTLSGLNVGGSGEALIGGAATMSLDQIVAMEGPITGVIALYDQAGKAAIQAGTQVTTANQSMGLSIKEFGPLSAEATKSLFALNDTIGKGFPKATDEGAQALETFGASAQTIIDQMLAGNITLDEAKTQVIDYAAQAGLAVQPLADFNLGLITQDQALQAVLNAAAAVNPAYQETATALETGAISADTAALNFLQLAASTKGVTDSVVTTQAALTTMAASIPNIVTLFNTGQLSAGNFDRAIVGLANSSGLAKQSLDLSTASTGELASAVSAIVQEVGTADPRFKDLSETIRKQGGLTDATRLQLLNLFIEIGKTAGVVDPAITAYNAAGSAATTSSATQSAAWQTTLSNIDRAVQSIDATVKKLADAIVGYIGKINSEDIKIEADYKEVEKAADALDDLGEAYDELPKGIRTGNILSGLLHGGKAMGGPVLGNHAYITGERGPELFLPGVNGTILPNSFFSGSAAKGGGAITGGGLTIQINAPVYGVNQLEDVILMALDRAERRGRIG